MKVSYSDTDRVIALAGLFQSVGLVRDIAHKGLCGAQAEQASLNSLFVFDASTTMDIFGEMVGIRYGLQTLHTQLEEPQQRDLEVAQYAVSLVHLADKSLEDNQRLDAITDALHVVQVNRENPDFAEMDDLYQPLAKVYQEHVSDLQPQIMVKGKPLYLENPQNVARIRSLLLAGLRAAILWRQCKGRKYHLLFSRGKIVELAGDLLNQI